MDLYSDLHLLPFSLPNEKDYSATWNDALNGFEILLPHGKLFYSEHYFSQEISDRCMEYLLANHSCDWKTQDWTQVNAEQLRHIAFKHITWQQSQLTMYGNTVLEPRFSAWYGDVDKPYTYSGLTLRAKPWNKGLIYLREQVTRLSGVAFNSVLLNWYRHGEDHLSWHADDEKELGFNPVIASVNLGVERDFDLRLNDKSQKVIIPLKHGSVLIMSGELQHYWQHSVPKRKCVNGSRINLTFRHIKS